MEASVSEVNGLLGSASEVKGLPGAFSELTGLDPTSFSTMLNFSITKLLYLCLLK